MVAVCRSVRAAITGFHSKGLVNWADMSAQGQGGGMRAL
jgi:hypothetical protein